MPKATTNHPALHGAVYTTPSSDSSTERTICRLPETLASTPQLVGRFPFVRLVSDAGLTFIPESEIGIGELNTKLTQAVVSEIASAIESFILIDLIPYLRTLSRGSLKALSRKYVLEVRSASGERSRGPNCSFKFTIRLYSKSHLTGRERPLLSISLEDILKIRSPIPTHSSSSGESQPQPPLGENAASAKERE